MVTWANFEILGTLIMLVLFTGVSNCKQQRSECEHKLTKHNILINQNLEKVPVYETCFPYRVKTKVQGIWTSNFEELGLQWKTTPLNPSLYPSLCVPCDYQKTRSSWRLGGFCWITVWFEGKGQALGCNPFPAPPLHLRLQIVYHDPIHHGPQSPRVTL